MARPTVTVARAVFPEILRHLRAHLDVRDNQTDELWTPAQLASQLQGSEGLFCTAGERIDASLLAACPQLRICASTWVATTTSTCPGDDGRRWLEVPMRPTC